MSDIVQLMNNWRDEFGYLTAGEMMDRAADEIVRLRAEVERLRLTDAEREALEAFAFDRPMDRATAAQTAATLRAILARMGGAS